MNTPGIIQEIGAAVAASPVCCRLLEVSIEVAVLAAAVWGLIHLLRIRSARVCSLLWILVLAKGLLGLAFGAPFELAGLRVAASAGTGQSVAAAGMTQEERALRDEEIRRALSEMESLSTTARAGSQGAADREKALPPAQVTASQRDRGASARWEAVLDVFSVRHAAATLVGVWVMGALWGLLRTALDLRRIRRLCLASAEAPEELLAVFRAEVARLGIPRGPRLRVCDQIESPALVGFLKPTVLLPRWLAETATPVRVRWMLAHELMHYKQKDSAGLLIRRAAEILLWFHPAVWWAGGRWEEAMERACDRALIAGESDARDYAGQLYQVLEGLVERRSRVRVRAGLFATRTQIGRRIAALLTTPLSVPSRLSPSALTLLVLLALAALSFGVGINQAAPEDEKGKTGAEKEQTKSAKEKVETQTRGRLSDEQEQLIREKAGKAMADLRSLAVGMEAYRVDHDTYAPSLVSLTTPVAYLSGIPSDPFSTQDPADPYRLNVNSPDYKPILYSIGPDAEDQKGLLVFDPTNGTMSQGDLVRYLQATYKIIEDTDLKAKIEKQQSLTDEMKTLVFLWFIRTRQGLPENLEEVVRATGYLKDVPEDMFVPGRKLSYRLDAKKETAWIYSLGPDAADDGGDKKIGGVIKQGEIPKGDIFTEIYLADLQDRYPEIPEPLDRRLLEHIPKRYVDKKSLVEPLLDLQEKENRPNALLYYVAAGFMIPPIPNNTQKDLIQNVLSEGWSEKAEPLKPYIETWQPAFNLIRKGAVLDYAKGIGSQGPLTPVPNFLAAQLGAKALCLEGRYLESLGKHREALEDYLTALTMGRDYMSPGNSLISPLVGVAVISVGTGQIRALVTAGKLAPADLERCRTRLEAIDKDYPSFADAFRVESLHIRWWIDRIRKDGNAEGLIAESKMPPETATELRQAVKDIDRIEADHKKLWDTIVRNEETPWWKQNREEYNKELERIHAASHPLVAKTVPNFLEAGTRGWTARAGLRLARVATGLEIYKLQNGRYPDSLDALTPAQIGAEPPVDPFAGKSFRYRLDGDRYAMWSLGPDSADNAAETIYDPTNGTMSQGDIILKLSPAQTTETEAPPPLPSGAVQEKDSPPGTEQQNLSELPDPLDRRVLEHIPKNHENERALVKPLLDLQEKEKRPNALLYYVVAGFVATDNDTQHDLIRDVLRDGWSEKAASLKPYIEAYQPAFGLIRKGAALDYAKGIGYQGPATPVPNFRAGQYAEGIGYHGPSTPPVPNLLAAQLSAKALSVEGRYFESVGRYREALENYLTVIAMGRDYMSSGDIVSHLVGIAITSIGAAQIRAEVTTGKLSPADLERCRTRLEAIDRNYPSIADAFRIDSLCAKWWTDRIRKDGNAEGLIAEGKLPSEEAAKMRQGAKDIDRIEADQKKLWDAIVRNAETPWWKQNREEYEKEFERIRAASHPLLANAVPNFLEAFTRGGTARAGLRLARVAAGLEIYKLGHGRYPDSLDALTPTQIGNEPPVDPFTGKSLRYRLDGDRYALWSIGPDSADNAAETIYDPTNGTMSQGDIILRR